MKLQRRERQQTMEGKKDFTIPFNSISFIWANIRNGDTIQIHIHLSIYLPIILFYLFFFFFEDDKHIFAPWEIIYAPIRTKRSHNFMYNITITRTKMAE